MGTNYYIEATGDHLGKCSCLPEGRTFTLAPEATKLLNLKGLFSMAISPGSLTIVDEYGTLYTMKEFIERCGDCRVQLSESEFS